MSWNRGAERLFGYSADEMIGKSVTILIPAERQDEEPHILGRIRRGEHIEHYETVRLRKDGSLIDISLSVSPIKGAGGKIIGASKIARDISERKQAQARQDMLTRELHHRTKNLFAVVQSVVFQKLDTGVWDGPEVLKEYLRGKLSALELSAALCEQISCVETVDSAAITSIAVTCWHGRLCCLKDVSVWSMSVAQATE